MTTWALVPIKRLERCKTRLAGVLKPRQREAVVTSLLLHVVDVLRATPGIDHVGVVSNERDDMPDEVTLFPDEGVDLNSSLQKALEQAVELGASMLVVVPADLPLLEVEDVAHLLNAARSGAVAIAPDRHERGTNALCMSTSTRLLMQFGANSFARHSSQARTRFGDPQIIRSPTLGFDLDTAEDWRFLMCHGRALPSPDGLPREASANGYSIEELLRAPLDELMMSAQRLTLAGHGRLVSYSRQVVIPLTELCRDVCRSGTFANTPRSLPCVYLPIERVLSIARAGVAAGCQEALFTLACQPEKRYPAARRVLAKMGYGSTLEYLAVAAKRVLEETGLLPHLNPGVLSEEDLGRLRPVSVSMGMMLEPRERTGQAERFSSNAGSRWGSPDKSSALRLATLKAAGERAVPFTTGLLIGMGETRRERLESLLAIRELHRQYGHIQEIIIQNFPAQPGTPAPQPALEEQLWTLAAARLLFGESMSIQAPPNPRPGVLQALIRAGVDDWGGVFPDTPDSVNREASWPHVQQLQEETASADRELVERLAIGPAYAQDVERWVDPALRAIVRRHCDAVGLARADPWHAGAGDPVPKDAASWIGNGRRRSRVESISTARILDRAQRGQTLVEQEIVALFAARGRELSDVLLVADRLRQGTKGDTVTYVVNRNINYTNICTYECGFCAFSKSRSARPLRGSGYRLDLDEIGRRTVEARQAGATEVCLQGGIHPSFTGQTYIDLVTAVKAAVADMHVHAFSPLEITQGARTLGLSLSQFLSALQAAGLSSLPGTAAEILDDEVRSLICPDKINTEQWLAVMSHAHEIGLRSTATIMFGHADHPRHWARHLLRVRALQERTGGFTELVPLPFVHMEAPMWRHGSVRSGPTYREAVLMHAVARLALNPLIPNIQTSWVKMGVAGAAFCLRVGANDLGGTWMNESITPAAGGFNGQELGPERIAALAGTIGRPVRQRTTLYDVARPGAARDPGFGREPS